MVLAHHFPVHAVQLAVVELDLGQAPGVVEDGGDLGLRIARHFGVEGRAASQLAAAQLVTVDAFRTQRQHGRHLGVGGVDSGRTGRTLKQHARTARRQVNGIAHLHADRVGCNQHQGLLVGREPEEDRLCRERRQAQCAAFDAIHIGLLGRGRLAGTCLVRLEGLAAEEGGEHILLGRIAVGRAHAQAVALPEHDLTVGRDLRLLVGEAVAAEVAPGRTPQGIDQLDFGGVFEAGAGDEPATVGRPGEMQVILFVRIDRTAVQHLDRLAGLEVHHAQGDPVLLVGHALAVGTEQRLEGVGVAADQHRLLEGRCAAEAGVLVAAQARLHHVPVAIAFAGIDQRSAVGRKAHVPLFGRGAGDAAGLAGLCRHDKHLTPGHQRVLPPVGRDR